MTPIQLIAMDDQILQIITFFIVLFGVILELYELTHYKNNRYWNLAMIFWMCHALFFYVFIFLERYSNLDITPLFGSYTLWSSVMRLHIIATIMILEFYRNINWKLNTSKRKLNEELLVVNTLNDSKELIQENKILLENIHDLLEERKNKNV
jgi:hypothetical protein